MEHEARATSVSPSEKTIPIDRGRTLVSPRFDDKSVQRARPAIPIAERGRARGYGSSMVLVACIVAGLIGGVAGGLALALYQKRNAAATRPSAIVVGEASSPTSTSSTSTSSPAAAPNDEATTAQPADANDVATTPASSSPPSPAEAAPPAEAAAGEREADGREHAELRGALDEWVAATNARDIGRQMSFYGETVGAFYRTRNVPRAIVRAEKARVFGSANVIDIRAAAPTVRVSRDGQTATMRFRKKYTIEGGGKDRRGEVLQELRWRRTRDGWKIVSERDLRVLN